MDLQDASVVLQGTFLQGPQGTLFVGPDLQSVISKALYSIRPGRFSEFGLDVPVTSFFLTRRSSYALAETLRHFLSLNLQGI